MNLLCIDTANSKLSLALKCGEVSYFYCSERSNSQAEDIAIEIDNILTKASLSYHDIGVFGVNLGPGSFTGVRIGVGYLSGLIAFEKKSIITVDTLDIVFFNSKLQDAVVILPADFTGGVFIKEYASGKAIGGRRYIKDIAEASLEGKGVVIDSKIKDKIARADVFLANKSEPGGLLAACLSGVVLTDFDGLLNPIYLKGDFDV